MTEAAFDDAMKLAFGSTSAPRLQGARRLSSWGLALLLLGGVALLVAAGDLLTWAAHHWFARELAPASPSAVALLFPMARSSLAELLQGALLWPLWVLLATSISWAFARVAGGGGSLRDHAFFQVLAGAALVVLMGFAQLVPGLGALVTFGLFLYLLVVQVRILRFVHSFSTARAVATFALTVGVLAGASLVVPALFHGLT